ncbi:muramoyltetrapeptide carboxypeptidase [Superficieibacter sp. 1612_C1]|uniref:muramoyltetrapeptide carboxypeptidase n=1 Tax=Superficieibacter sp. 1612_C1 TaxID=2780382 RepID=UPI0018839FFE|nr:muramoyltetrapeptide carboxypeptidase [Superficieibacter sp. 1612_C1]
MSLIHLIAPSGYCINQAAAARGVERLEAAGHQVENREAILRREQRFAGTEQARLADINSLATLEGQNRIVMAVRGGYGASRLLEDIDWSALVARQQQDPLLICGHSDFTAIQMGLLAAGNVITFSGPMLAGNFGAETLDAFTEYHFWQALRNPVFTLEWSSDGPDCQASGILWGGNLAMLVSLIGTPWLPTIENGILVVEDINEHPFRVERMLLQLHYAGVLNRQQAIVLGSFSGVAANDYDAGYDLQSMCRYLRSRLRVPVISGLDFGHEPRTVTLPLGAQATLVQHGATSTLTVSGHPVLNT